MSSSMVGATIVAVMALLSSCERPPAAPALSAAGLEASLKFQATRRDVHQPQPRTYFEGFGALQVTAGPRDRPIVVVLKATMHWPSKEETVHYVPVYVTQGAGKFQVPAVPAINPEPWPRFTFEAVGWSALSPVTLKVLEIEGPGNAGEGARDHAH